MTTRAAAAVEPGSSYPRVVNEVRSFGITTGELATITRVKERQVQNWVAGTSKPQADSRDRLVDVHYIVQRLADVYKPEGVEIWLHARNRELGGKRPIDLLIDGDFEDVIHAVERLTTGAM